MKKIGEVADLYQGLAINSKTKHLLVEDGPRLPLLRIKDLLEDSEEFFIDHQNAPKKSLVEFGNLIFTRTGQVGYVFNNRKGVLHNNCFKIIPKDERVLSSGFLYHYFNRENVRDYLESISAGSVQPDMNHSIFKLVEVPVPPIEEQHTISSILSSLDNKIDLLHRQNQTLEQMAETLFRQWFVEEADEEGEEGKLGDLVEVKYGKDHKKLLDGLIPVYGSGGLMRTVEKALFEGESVLIPRKGSLNNVMYVDEAFWTVDTMFYTIMKKGHIAKFIYQFIKQKDLASMNVGSAVPSMTTTVINNMPILIPPDNLLEKFDGIVFEFYNKIKSNQTQIRTLTTLRDTLLPKLMSGEVRVEMDAWAKMEEV